MTPAGPTHYDLDVVDEAIVKAYAIGGWKIRLLLFADRLELYSPGKLPDTTLDDMPYRTLPARIASPKTPAPDRPPALQPCSGEASPLLRLP